AGNITQTGALTVAGTSALDATGNIVLTNPANDFGDAVSATGNDISLVDVNNLTVSVTAGGLADLKAGEALTVSGSTGGNLTTDSGAGTNFGPTSVGGALFATAGNDIAQTGALTVTAT